MVCSLLPTTFFQSGIYSINLTHWLSLQQRTRQTQPPLPNRQAQHLSLTLRQYEPHYTTSSTNSTTLTHWQTKSPRLNTTRQTKRPLPTRQTYRYQSSLSLRQYEPTTRPTRHSRLTVTRWGRLKLHTLTQLDTTPYQIGKLNNAHFL